MKEWFPKHKRFSKQAAQTAVEIAVFGAVLIFVLGVMIRQAYNAHVAQNQVYKAMRLALTQSYLTSIDGLPSRNTASVFILEDRLSPATEKYGPLTRVPLTITATGTHTRELFQPTTFNQQNELTRTDFYINGQHFVFTIAGFKQLNNLHLKNPPGFPPINFPSGHPDWDPECAYRYVLNTASGNLDILQWMGCRRFYKIVPNYIKVPDKNQFCCADAPTCDPIITAPPSVAANWACDVGTRCCQPDNFNANTRFDLDRNPLTNASGVLGDVITDERPMFAWQWYLVKGFNPNRSGDRDPTPVNWGPLNILVNPPRPFMINFGDSLVIFNDPDDSNKNKNTDIDVDRDFKEEQVLLGSYNGSGVITSLSVLDLQEGDLDFSYDKRSPGPRPGLLDEMNMFSFTREGTYLLLREGKLYAPDTRQFVRNVQKRDRIDIVQRVIQLSNDTGRFCPGSPPTAVAPVEACNDCFNLSNVDKTCFDQGSKLLYVRSRIKDLGGKKWITPVTSP